MAKYENIVYFHDYICLNFDWYEGFLKFGNNWKVCMNVIKNPDNTRFRDWNLWIFDIEKVIPQIEKTREVLISYDMTHLSKYMYISGSYWVAKKSVMEEFPLNEFLLWEQGEDVEWSQRVREKYNFSMNPYSLVKLIKHKDIDFIECSEKTLKKLKNLK